MAEYEATMKFVVNLDRSGIESKLQEAAAIAVKLNIAEAVNLLGNPAGKSADELNQLIVQCINVSKGNPAAKGLVALLEMIQVNLSNLK